MRCLLFVGVVAGVAVVDGGEGDGVGVLCGLKSETR